MNVKLIQVIGKNHLYIEQKTKKNDFYESLFHFFRGKKR